MAGRWVPMLTVWSSRFTGHTISESRSGHTRFVYRLYPDESQKLVDQEVRVLYISGIREVEAFVQAVDLKRYGIQPYLLSMK